MVGNPELIFFYVSQFMTNAVWYIPHLDAWTVAELEDGILTIHNIFAPANISIDALAAAFGQIRQITLGFMPADPAGWEQETLQEEDCHFFVRGSFFRDFDSRRMRIPSLSHA